MSGIDGRDPIDDYEQLIEELGAYDPDLLAKPRLIVANKMDEEASADNLKLFKAKHSVDIQPISCLSEEGMPELKQLLWGKVSEAKAEAKEAEI